MSQQEKWYIEKYIQLLYEIEQGLDDDECEDRFQEAIRKTQHQKYSPSTRSKPKTRRKKRVH